MAYERAELIYLLNLIFTVAYAVAMFIYLGRHDTRASSARALQRSLVSIISWAFYDLVMAHIARTASPETAFFLYRFLSFMWLAYSPLACEQVMTIFRPVRNIHRLLFSLPFAALYFFHLFFPGYTSGRVYGIPGGWPVFPAPWQIAHNITWIIMFSFLAAWLGHSIVKENDPKARKEKTVLLAGIIATMAAVGLSRLLLQVLPPGFPALGNTANFFFVLAAFIGLRRYGRVLSLSTIYRTTANSIPNGLVHVHKGHLTWANGVFLKIAGLPSVGAGDTPEGKKIIGRLAGSSGLQATRINDSFFMVTEIPVDPDDAEMGTLYVLVDITDRENAAAEREQFIHKLERLSTTDDLTGIYNRRFFDNRLNEEWNRLMRSQFPLSLLMIDIDFFKNFNDSYGHQAGDDCLREVAQAIKLNCRRAIDIPARYGGEEFAVILPEIGADGAMAMAEAIRADIESLNIAHRASSIKKTLSVSTGVATLMPVMELDPSAIVSLADRALYDSKKNGRDRVTMRRHDG